MNKNRTKLLFKKRVRKTVNNVEVVQEVAANTVDKHLFRRWGKLKDVRRFVIGWLALVLVLSLGVWLQGTTLKGYYQEDVPAYGGTYFEGAVGEFTSLNPIFAVTSVDASVAKLTFSSLLKYDDDNKLVGDLATSWSVNKEKVIYTVKLRDDVYWHDGQKLTADDVVFTYEAIQQPATKSPLADSWKGIAVQAVDDYTVTFSLPNPYTPFPYSLTNGIIPKHLLGDIPYDELRSSDFNFDPIGSGPFKFDRLVIATQPAQAILSANEGYYLNRPYLDEMVIEAYEDREDMLNAFVDGELSAASDLQTVDIDRINSIESAKVLDYPLFGQVYLFLNNKDALLRDRDIRTALVYATDKQAVFDAVKFCYPLAGSPLIEGQLGYDKKLTQPKFNLEKANQILDKAGWKRGEDGIRIKDGKKLEINIVSQGNGAFPDVLSAVQKSWREAGVAASLEFVDEQEFTRSNIAPHNYQALAFGITQGVDPDVFVYWHSSQAVKNGFNFSNYKSEAADVALEAGRTRSDPKIRAVKYKSFLEEWTKDNPAIVLYRPVFKYVVRDNIKGLTAHSISSPTDRFDDVLNWSVMSRRADKKI